MYFVLDTTRHLWCDKVHDSALLAFPSLLEVRQYHTAMLTNFCYMLSRGRLKLVCVDLMTFTLGCVRCRWILTMAFVPVSVL